MRPNWCALSRRTAHSWAIRSWTGQCGRVFGSFYAYQVRTIFSVGLYLSFILCHHSPTSGLDAAGNRVLLTVIGFDFDITPQLPRVFVDTTECDHVSPLVDAPPYRQIT